MKTRIAMGAAAAAVALSLEGGHAFSPKSPAVTRLPRAALTLVQDSNGRFHGIGVVTDIDQETGALTVNHQEIKGLMPAMEMLFNVDPRSLSAGVKPGDRIEFSVEDKTYTIRDLKVVEHAK
jgi:Cu/Ag efflux protein CusF